MTMEAGIARRVYPKVDHEDEVPSTLQLPAEESQHHPQPEKCFAKIPSEIIHHIFQHCREPALIHTCQRFHQLLPSYQDLTRRLVGLALVDTTPPMNPELALGSMEEFDEESTVALANDLFALPELRAPLSEESRNLLQAGGFPEQVVHVAALPQDLLQYTLRAPHYGVSGSRQLSTVGWQEDQSLKSYQRLSQPFATVSFKFRIRTLNFGIHTAVLRTNSIAIISETNFVVGLSGMIRIQHIPDMILIELPSIHAQSVLQLVLGPLANHPEENEEYEEVMPPNPDPNCSPQALQNAFLRSLRRYGHVANKAEATKEMQLFSNPASSPCSA